MEFSYKKLHKADANQMFMRVFDGWIMQNEYYENGVNETLSRIYIDGTEAFSNLYNKGTLQAEYENVEAYFNTRENICNNITIFLIVCNSVAYNESVIEIIEYDLASRATSIALMRQGVKSSNAHLGGKEPSPLFFGAPYCVKLRALRCGQNNQAVLSGAIHLVF